MTNFDELSSYYQPAEWQPHKFTWTAWPFDAEIWLDELTEAQKQFTEMVLCLSESEPVHVLVANKKAKAEAMQALKSPNISFVDIPYGDIWLRDIAPIFLKSKSTEKKAACFAFNGWGGKYVFAHDDSVGEQICISSDLPYAKVPLVFEGGSIDVNGSGLGLTTRECLFNPNRNPELSELQIEDMVKKSLGLDKILWLGQGLLNDHTDGHIDNIARFVDTNKVVCMKPSGKDDPNAETYENIFEDLCGMRNLQNEPLEVIQIASPGLVKDKAGEILPASHMNFYISNKTVLLPTYGTDYDSEAVSQIAKLFPDRKTVGIKANAILTGGGSFHCITQQEPL